MYYVYFKSIGELKEAMTDAEREERRRALFRARMAVACSLMVPLMARLLVGLAKQHLPEKVRDYLS